MLTSTTRQLTPLIVLSTFLISCHGNPLDGSQTDASTRTLNNSHRIEPPSRVHGATRPNPDAVVLNDADIYDVSGGDLITVISEPFPDDAVVGCWIEVRTTEDLPPETFRIVSNTHFEQNNISVFSVAEDLESVGGSDWWFYDGQNVFDILAPYAQGRPDRGGRGAPSEIESSRGTR